MLGTYQGTTCLIDHPAAFVIETSDVSIFPPSSHSKGEPCADEQTDLTGEDCHQVSQGHPGQEETANNRTANKELALMISRSLNYPPKSTAIQKHADYKTTSKLMDA